MKELELYLHIPFCAKKCAYCDFLSAPAGRKTQEAYVEALKREIHTFPEKEKYRVSTVFFGGGTPSILEAGKITEIMDLLHQEFLFLPDAEVTIECNPGTAGLHKLAEYRKAGINRLSLGLQSSKNQELSLLGRIHTWEDFLQTYDAARKVGFDNINVDLMSALPGQSVQSWRETLEAVLALCPQHISAYSLIIEEGTSFYETYHEDDERRSRGENPRYLPSEEEEREMYCMTEELLAEAGMERYEISNYALPGFACRHNIGYWNGTEYAGFGLGASSLLQLSRPYQKIEKGIPELEEKKTSGLYRVKNPDSMEKYLKGDFSEREYELLTRQNQMEEFMFLGLRMIKGISEKEFETKFGIRIDEVYQNVLKRQQTLGFLERKEGGIRLTSRGLDVSNAVMAEFLL
ncbi:MAG: radical SAM family heme chaperone HemW [Lachnospiraceae bacterium]|nr:radical SAM family heme chaperone HemW [Lachnospiraceae bacterium]